jgi:hypothetical protein
MGSIGLGGFDFSRHLADRTVMGVISLGDLQYIATVDIV